MARGQIKATALRAGVIVAETDIDSKQKHSADLAGGGG
jgi:hypothetical protein